MPTLLALDWDQSEARVAAASLRGSEVVVEQAFSFALPAEAEIGPQIAAELARRGLSRTEGLVVVDRASFELRQLSIPAAPEEELPDLVRFQAMREFGELGDDWRLDFVPLDEDPTVSREVLAAAMAPAPMERIEAISAAAGVKPRRILPRAWGAASLLSRTKPPREDELRLLVDLRAGEAELTAVLGKKVVFLRAARFASPAATGGGREIDPQAPPSLLAELRRTLAAVQNQWSGRKVEAIVLFGGDRCHAGWAKSIEAELGTATATFNPFEGLSLGRELLVGAPENADRFAAVLGTLLAELEQTGHGIDFLNPRRPAPPPNRRKKYVWAAVAAVLLLVGYLGFARIRHATVLGQVEELQAQSKALDDAVVRADKVRSAVSEINKWTDSDVVWLEQLRALSTDFPGKEDAMLNHLTCGPATGGGEMRLKGMARKADVIESMQKALDSRKRHVVGKVSREDRSLRSYSWRFETSVTVPRELPP